MQFCDGAEFEDTKVESIFNVEFEGDTREVKFIGKSNKLLKAGWKNINNIDEEDVEDIDKEILDMCKQYEIEISLIPDFSIIKKETLTYLIQKILNNNF